MKKLWGVLLACLFASLAACNGSQQGSVTVSGGDDRFLAGEAAWRAQRKENLLRPDGWTSLVGLFWLENVKQHFIGSSADNGFKLDFGPAKLGMIEQGDGHVWLAPEQGVALTLDGQPLAGNKVELHNDNEAAPSVVGFDDGKGQLILIKRGDRLGIRVKHANAPSRLLFAGLDYWDASEDWRIVGKFVPNPPGTTLPIVDIIGVTDNIPNPGAVEFKKDGQTLRLQALDEGDGSLSLIFVDRTSGHGSYPAGRFLEADKPDANGNVVLDFNRAYNPPCAFTPFATCPLPPPENRLADIAITAGEKTYKHPGAPSDGAPASTAE